MTFSLEQTRRKKSEMTQPFWEWRDKSVTGKGEVKSSWCGFCFRMCIGIHYCNVRLAIYSINNNKVSYEDNDLFVCVLTLWWLMIGSIDTSASQTTLSPLYQMWRHHLAHGEQSIYLVCWPASHPTDQAVKLPSDEKVRSIESESACFVIPMHLWRNGTASEGWMMKKRRTKMKVTTSRKGKKRQRK